MLVWVYRPLYGSLELIVVPVGQDEEDFASSWCEYFPHDIYFLAELVSL